MSDTFWGHDGRIALIQAGKWEGCVALVFPESRPEWYTFVVDPSPVTGVPGDYYFEGAAEMARLEAEGGFVWLPIGPAERELESERIGWRPLTPPPSRWAKQLNRFSWMRDRAEKRWQKRASLIKWSESEEVRAIFPKRI